MIVRVGIVVPEYRTPQAPGGGVASVADFILDALDDHGDIEYEVISPRTFHGARESQRLFAPRSWFRGPQVVRAIVGGRTITYVGSRWAEFEPLRFKGSRQLRRALVGYEALVVVCGTPSSFEMVRGVNVPVLGQVATIVAEERKQLLASGSLLKRVQRSIATKMVSRLDESGVKIPRTLLVENPWMKEWSEANGAANPTIDLPGIDVAKYAPADRTDDAVRVRPPYILSMGRLADPRKNLPLLVRAYGRARKEYGVTQRLVLAGRGVPPAEAIEAIHELDLSAYVEVASDVPIDELPSLYREADFFAMSSSEEGLGMVLMEAMASALPVVSTATEGAKVVVGDSLAGVLVCLDEGAESNLAAAIRDYANDPAARRAGSEAARARALSEFSAEQAGRRYIAAIAELREAQ